jgi:hypothetical protein
MKKPLALAALAIALTANLSCEQQTWDQTKMFNQNRHATHGEAHGSGSDTHAAGHAAPAASHAPAPAAH